MTAIRRTTRVPFIEKYFQIKQRIFIKYKMIILNFLTRFLLTQITLIEIIIIKNQSEYGGGASVDDGAGPVVTIE